MIEKKSFVMLNFDNSSRKHFKDSIFLSIYHGSLTLSYRRTMSLLGVSISYLWICTALLWHLRKAITFKRCFSCFLESYCSLVSSQEQARLESKWVCYLLIIGISGQLIRKKCNLLERFWCNHLPGSQV